MRLKAYKYRIYPTESQKILLSKTFGCVRFVYNKALNRKNIIYQTTKKSLSIFSIINEMVGWKKEEELKWLNEVNSQSLQASLRNLDIAYTNFFRKKSDFPKFKSKKNRQSFTNPQRTIIDWDKNKVYIPKFKSGIKTIFDRKFEGEIKQSTISKTPTDKYYISILVQENIKIPKCKKPKENKTLGIDLGIKHFLVDSDGNKVENPRYLAKKLKKLKRLYRKLSKKKKGGKNREKARQNLAKVYERVTNCRKDFLHKLTKSIVDNQNYTSVAIENLDVKDMLKNKIMAKHISDVGWGIFKKFLEYKCKWYGKNLLIIGRFEPSSKLCTCGYLNSQLKLSQRIWICPKCDTKHDRDILAANNIKRFAFKKQNTYNENTVGNTEINAYGESH